MSDSKTPDTVAAVGSKTGAAVAATPLKGGVLLSPLPLNGGRRKSRRGSKKSRRGSKKVAKALKKMGGVEEAIEAAQAAGEMGPEGEAPTAGFFRRRRSSRRRGYSRRASRGYLY